MASRDSLPTASNADPSEPSVSEDTVVRGDALIGRLLGDYQVLERIGEGGMGVVYRGLHPTIKKRVAIKVLKPSSDDPQQARRLVTEAEAVNAIGHRNIIDIFGHGTLEDGRHYLVMEFLDGDSLDTHLERRGRLPWQEACALLVELCRPLQAAHARGVIHRDLKPSNIFLVQQRDGSRELKLLDFGLAKLTNSAFESSQQSNVMQVSGTPAYMAPEQSRALPVSAGTDLYALGIIAFELFAGRLPFIDKNPMDVMMAHVNRAPPLVGTFSPELPEALQALVQQLLEKEPARRPASAEVVRLVLEQALAKGAAEATAPTEELRLEASRAAQPAVRTGPSRAALWVLGVVVLAVGGLSVWLDRPEPEVALPPPNATIRPLPPMGEAPVDPPAVTPPVVTPPAVSPPVVSPPVVSPQAVSPHAKTVQGEAQGSRSTTSKPRPPPTAQELVERIRVLRARIDTGDNPNPAIAALLQRLSLRAASADTVEQRSAVEQKVLRAEKRYPAP